MHPTQAHLPTVYLSFNTGPASNGRAHPCRGRPTCLPRPLPSVWASVFASSGWFPHPNAVCGKQGRKIFRPYKADPRPYLRGMYRNPTACVGCHAAAYLARNSTQPGGCALFNATRIVRIIQRNGNDALYSAQSPGCVE
jgi:hypothetical protein